ncbi:translation elongation factor Ts [Salibacteraceae bacterium]|jgi:elongation factor Ts|nr:translation elongation factor Ts [Salibacteraceae bacterium]MDA9267476.1 translation elongation factor Ts [Salibacteraceae bacterium]MDB4105741.1 translation elongation factor Ts [Salibacteraceae bacterium]MDB9708342.1 translation elongation factor Ts [Salibacteraceae bacterium]MDC1305009.1 translation elongation factor Ts [Salibacteraceae bacterium]
MSKITASEVNRLRQMTGSGMMDCKKALVEAEGDFEKAIEILRKQGQKVAAKRGDREASEGLVVAKTDASGKKGVIAILSCETDFVAKNAEFGQTAEKMVDIALNTGVKTADELKSQPFGDGLTVSEKITEMIGKIGEKIDLGVLDIIEAETVVAYNHPGNQVASMVGLNKAGENVSEAGRDVAMQIAAMNPVALDKDSVATSVIEKEIEIGMDIARQEGKPEEMLEKIAQGKLNKFFKENTLLSQAFIKDNKKSVEQMLKEIDGGITVTSFKRYGLN